MKGIDEYIKMVTNVRTSIKDGTCEDFKKEGFLRYRLGDYFEAATAYTRCVALSALTDPDDPELAIAYANRSAVLMAVGHFGDSVRDAERAIANNYPEMLRFRLHLRMAICFREMGEVEKAQEHFCKTKNMIARYELPEEKKKEMQAIAEKNFGALREEKVARVKIEYQQPPELSYGASSERPCLSSAVDIKTNEKYGRHWVANRDLQTGDIILKEDPAVSGLKIEAKWTHCNHCFKISFALIPCDACKKVLYCSDACQESARVSHSTICAPFKKYEDVLWPQLTLSDNICTSFTRIFDLVARFGLENCSNYDNPSYPPNPELLLLREFIELLHHPVPYMDNLRALNRAIFTHCFGIDDPDKLTKLSELCSLALLKHNANSFSVEECFIFKPSEEFDSNHIAYGSYHTASLANHSCDSNVASSFFLKTKVSRVIKPVKKGEQLFIKYCNSFYNLPREIRQERMKLYNFECDCEPCKLEWPIAKLMIEEPDFLDQTSISSLKSLIKKESKFLGLAIAYYDLIDEKNLELCKNMQKNYFSPNKPRLDKVYRLIEMFMYYHWAARTKLFIYEP